MSLHVLAYNLKRVMKILGFAKTLRAMKLAGAKSHTCLCLLAWRNQFSRRKQEAAKAQPHQSLDRLPAHAFLHGLGQKLTLG